MRLSFAVAALLAPLALAAALTLSGSAEADDPVQPADDVRVGTVLAVEGRAYVRPGTARRWTPLRPDAVLLPGDVVKTPTRGAHAIEIALSPGGSLLLGPGGLVELPARGALGLLAGEAEVRGGVETPVSLGAAVSGLASVTGTAWLRAEGTTVLVLPDEPRWIRGYRASGGEEWMGSLLAQVDGRNVPLAVGYHKVTVDVRDQIARTTVEQSFLNSTDARLEGVFYFPLPADASISGFGMWIGGELVEADIVEKVRARQIYEDILRRKKDPGLLEWQGGNLFKARVFPIEAHAEKRIRIRYTQVLPLEGDAFRYRYALRSDLLRSKPLRRLDIQVNVISSRAIEDVASSSHAVLAKNTGHEARVAFEAEEFVPDRDFEVAVTLAPSAGIEAIAHRRGDDGYLMLLVTPPDEGGAGWRRALLPDGEPLDLVLWADTSLSMDEAAREVQAAFLESVLALLSPADHFRLAASDVDVAWAFDGARPATPESAAEALAWLRARPSLGWSDLDRGFDRVLAAASDKSVVIYLGDGIPTTGDADPAAQAERIRRRAADTQVSVHAVSCASTYETPVLESLASLGGSVRRGDEDPSGSAYALLSELARPTVKDLQVRIEGVPVARLYPARLPNLPLGSQQVVLARYQPTGVTGPTRVVVSGELAGAPVRYLAPLDLPATDAGNSFLPRLWARKHLDALLLEGSSAAVKDQIVAFSAEFGILTPYTSLLVLESDAERERYGVTRTVKASDGEAFFADARDRVALELKRHQAQRANAWRLALRRRMWGQISSLGRGLLPDATVHGTVRALGELATVSENAIYALGAGRGGPAYSTALPRLRSAVDKLGRGPGASTGGDWGAPESEEVARNALVADPASAPPAGGEGGFEESFEPEEDANYDIPPPPTTPAHRPASKARRRSKDLDFTPPETPNDGYFAGAEFQRHSRPPGMRSPSDPLAPEATLERSFRGLARLPQSRNMAFPAWPLDAVLTLEGLGFPALPTAHARVALPPPEWSPDVADALRVLDVGTRLAAVRGGLLVRRTEDRVHPARGETLAHAEEVALWAADRWAVRSDGDLAEPLVEWLDADVRGRLRVWSGLGRRRPTSPHDHTGLPPAFGVLAYDDLVEVLRRHRVTLEATSPYVRVRIQGPTLGAFDRVLVIDPRRGALVEERTEVLGEPPHRRTRHTGFVEVAGVWWPRLTETFDAEGRRVAFETREIELLDVAGVAARYDALTQTADALVLDGALPPVEEARQAVADGAPSLGDQLTLCLDAARLGEWSAAHAAWRRCVPAEATLRWPGRVDLALLTAQRAGTELLAQLRQEARSLAASVGDEASWRARVLFDLATRRLGADETLSLLEGLSSPWVSGGDRAALAYEQQRAAALDAVGRSAHARGVRERILEEHPHDLTALRAWVSDRRALGVLPTALPVVEVRTQDDQLTWEERDAAFTLLSDLLWELRDLPALGALTTRWTTAEPRSVTAWLRHANVRLLGGAVDEVDAWVLEQLQAPLPDAPRSVFAARRRAAVSLALGQGWIASGRRIEPAFVDPLADLGRRLARDGRVPAPLLGVLLSDWRFRRTDGSRRLRESMRADLLGDAAWATLSPARLRAYVSRLSWGTSDVEADAYEVLVEGLAARWTAMPAGREREAVGETLLTLYDAHGEKEAAVALLTAWIDGEAGWRKSPLATRLLDRLVASVYAPARESEALALLAATRDPYAPDLFERTLATAVRRIASWAYAGRRKAALGDPEALAALSRAEARARGREAADAARLALATALRDARDAAPALARPWLVVEALGYAVETGSDLQAIDAVGREALDGIPWSAESALARVLAERIVLALDNAALRRNADELQQNRWIAFLHARVADEADTRLDWRFQLFRFLVAADRTEDLEATLESWIRPGSVHAGWHVALAHLRAGRGDLDAAAHGLLAVTEQIELAPATWQVLADWLLVLSDDEARERALESRMGAMSEGQLANDLWQARRNLTRGGMSGDLDVETLRTLRWLMTKAARPENHLWTIRSLYESQKDHRLLSAVVRGLPGHTPEALYAFLAAAGDLIARIHEEATIDAVTASLRDVRAEAEAPHETRALSLLEALLHARAARVPNAVEGREEAAVRALEAVLEGTWVPGERRLLAGVLAGIRTPEHPRLARTQIDLLRTLHADLAKDSPDRLPVALALARTLWAYGERDVAVEQLGAALAEEREQGDGRLRPRADQAFGQWVDWLVVGKRFRVAEDALVEALATEGPTDRRRVHKLRLLRLHAEALAANGALAVGRGGALLDAATEHADAWLSVVSPAYADSVLGVLRAAHEAAHKARAVPDAGTRWMAYVTERLPTHFDRLVIESTSLVGIALHGLRELVSPQASLTYALDRLDVEPGYFDRVGLGLFSTQHYSLAKDRKRAGDIGDLASRLLPRVTERLEEWLAGGRRDGRGFWERRRDTYWAMQTDAFAAAAQRAVELAPHDVALQQRAAGYLRGLGRKREAVAVLRAAHARGDLADNATGTLVGWLVEDARYAEALPLLDTLRAARPDDLNVRRLTARALAGLDRKADALEALRAADVHWRAKDRLNAGVAATLGGEALTLEAWEAAEAWLDEAVRLRLAARNGRSGNDSMLGRTYSALAKARVHLGRTAEAVEAASAGVVAWGHNARHRTAALKALEGVLAAADDLDAWVEGYEARVATEGLDAPVLRKALARVYEQRGAHAQAAHHLLAARELAPEDAEIHQRLVAVYDLMGAGDRATAALLVSLNLAPRNLDAAGDLARRYLEGGRVAAAERALTSLVEMLPHEAAGHRRLAGILTSRQRAEAAEVQWRQVVRTEPLDPTGWLALAQANHDLGRTDEARRVLDHLLQTEWEARFGDVRKEAATLMTRWE